MRATSSNIGQLLKQRGDGKETAKKFSPMIIKKSQMLASNTILAKNPECNWIRRWRIICPRGLLKVIEHIVSNWVSSGTKTVKDNTAETTVLPG